MAAAEMLCSLAYVDIKIALRFGQPPVSHHQCRYFSHKAVKKNRTVNTKPCPSCRWNLNRV